MNCRKGDIAKIVQVKQPKFAPNVGKWLIVEELTTPSPSNGPRWVCTTLEPMIGFNGFELEERPAGSLVAIADKFLRPARGDKEPSTDQTIKELETC